MSLLMPEMGLVFWMLLAFGILFAILSKFAWPMITRMIDERTAYINNSVKAAEEANRQLENVKAESARLLADAQQDQMKILNEAAEIRNQIVAEAKEKAEVEAQKMIDDARRQIEAEKEKSLAMMRKQVAELSVEIAEKVLRANLENDARQSDTIDKMLNEIELR